ncbi:hypothetical protein Aperf_G00000017584 [Anoplocephala perfoliata]
MQSVLNFILSLCEVSCNSFTWINQLTPRRPDGLPFRLLLVVVEIELKLRLPSNLGGYLQVKTSDEKMISTCLDLLSLIIAQISVSDKDFADDTNDGVVGSLSDDSLTTIMNQLIGLGELMATSLAPDQDSPAPSDAPAITASSTIIQISPLLLHALTVYLQWLLSSYKDHYLGVTDDDGSALFDHTLFQTPPPENEEYTTLSKRFEEKVWKPLNPLMNSVIPMAFRLTNNEDSNTKWLTQCRKFLLRLARLFPAVVLSSFNCEFYECLLAKCSTEEEDILKSPSGLTYLTDISVLLDVTMIISPLDTSSAGDLGDVCVRVIGRLFSLLSRADWGSSMWKSLVFAGDSGAGNICKECVNRMWVQLLERFSDALALLRFLVVNFWQEEMAFCLRVAELSTLDEIREKKEYDPEKFLSSALLTFLQRLASLEPSSLLDLKLSNQLDPPLRGFYTPYTLRQSVEALFQCCHSCRGSEFCKRLMRKPEFKELETKICSDD